LQKLVKCRNMLSNVAPFRHSSRHAMLPSWVANTTHHVCKWRLGKTWQIKTFPAKSGKSFFPCNPTTSWDHLIILWRCFLTCLHSPIGLEPTCCKCWEAFFLLGHNQ
jgi:hypothetical protein